MKEYPMKKCTIFAITLAVSLAFSSLCLAQFEGVVRIKSTQTVEKKPMKITQEIFIKGDMVRSNITAENSPMGSVAMIIRQDKKVIWTVLDAMKMYMEMSMEKAEEMKKSMPKDTLKPTIKKTGKTQAILGHKCEEIRITTSDISATVWGTTELSSLAGAMKKITSRSQTPQSRWEQELENMNLVLLKMNIKNKTGEVTDLEITGIEIKSIADSQFQLPAGYTKQEMPTGMPGK
jgi:hypothetical protein